MTMYAKVPVRFQTPNSSLQVIKIQPFKQLLEGRENFIQQHYTDVELNVNYIGERRIQYLAGRWAAKRAIINILDNGREFSYLDLEILRLSTGQPSVILFGQCQAIATRLGIAQWLISISHTTTHAVASVVAIV
ncbi:holo-ACP synthase [Myxosarcina sp. GI1]|uniref:holo-ACP synthase n=1 Tax=Myxosarcina sp. GI1 TaxID=1541065 RepID=UPI00155B1000|nr:4'-phosphopantetheinyl transferase superfamily protein [Myxosarcina sp. GI1]